MSSGSWSEVDEHDVATRRRALLSQITASSEANELVSALTDARLLVTSRGEGDESVVEVAHEALFRSWPRPLHSGFRRPLTIID